MIKNNKTMQILHQIWGITVDVVLALVESYQVMLIIK